MEEKNQNIEETNKKDLTQEEIEDVQGGNARVEKLTEERRPELTEFILY